jgi:hypothetical protein
MTKALERAFEAASRLPDREQEELANRGELGLLRQRPKAWRLRVPGPRRDWRETRQAIDLLRQRRATGKVVLTIGG